MFPTLPINHVNTSSTAATTQSDDGMSISTSSCMYCLETDSLAPSPKHAVRTFIINPDSLIATPYDITNKEDGEISIEDTGCILHSPSHSPAAASKIPIPRETFQELHARPIPQITTEQISDQPNPLYSFPTDTTDTTSSVSRTTLTAEQIASEIN
jgi:hypothetical protein